MSKRDKITKKKNRTKKKSISRSLKKSLRRFKKSLTKSIDGIKNNIIIYKKLKNKYNIVDVPLDKKQNKGTIESSGFVDYHYQRLDNIINFMHLTTKDREDIHIFKGNDELSLELDIENNKINPIYSSNSTFKENIIKSKKIKYVPITFNVELITSSHATIILIDNENKNIEYFEPHGYKSDKSTLEGVVGAYYNKMISLKKYMGKLLPDYNFINISELFKREGFQMKHDARNGYCVTWSILYIHYRILNPDLKINILIRYIYYYVTKTILLRYAKYIEKVLKFDT